MNFATIGIVFKMWSCLVVLSTFCFFAVGTEAVELDLTDLNNTTRKNYTANDLIQLLSRLANEDIAPRLRFPSDDYDEGPNDVYSDNQDNRFIYENQNPNKFNNNIRFTRPQDDQRFQQGQFFNQNRDPNFDSNSDEIFSKPYDQQNQNNYQQQSPNFNNRPNQNGFQGQNNVYQDLNVFKRPSQYVQDGFYEPQDFSNFNPGPFYRPPRIRKPKKRPFNGNRPPFPIAQDPLDPYLQNYPPYQGQYPQGFQGGLYPNEAIQPGYAQNYQGYPQNPYIQGVPPSGLGDDQGPFGSLMNALNSIAKHDDQKCVPRLLCEVAAGGNPSYRQNSFLPSFLNTESLFTLLSALSGSVSPLLVFGRAALLGVTSQGRPSSCRYAYPECPRDPDKLVEYLNNHNGGFFRFFNGLGANNPDQFNFNGIGSNQIASTINTQQQNSGINQLSQLLTQLSGQSNQGQSGIYNPGQNGVYNTNAAGSYQLDSSANSQNFGVNQLAQLLAQLTGQNNFGQNGVDNSGQSGLYRPGQTGIYNKRPNLYSNSVDFGNYQRYPYRFHDYQNRASNNNDSTESVGEQSEARILNKILSPFYFDFNRDSDRIQNNRIPSNDVYVSQNYNGLQFVGNTNSIDGGAWKFPDSNRYLNEFISSSVPDDAYTKSQLKFPSSPSNTDASFNKRPKALLFPSSENTENQSLYFPKPLPFYDHTRMIFPDRTGTGNLKFDSNNLAPVYSSNFYRDQVPSNGQSGNLYQSGSQPANYYANKYQFPGQLQSSSQKKYVYIVRGNGDPNHPEIVEEGSARQSVAKSKEILAETNRRSGNPWTFPSLHQDKHTAIDE